MFHYKLKLHADINLHLLSILRHVMVRGNWADTTITPRDDTWDTELILLRHVMIRGKLSWYWYRHVMIRGILMITDCPIWTTTTAASASASTVVSIPDPMALSTSNISKSQTVIHHYVQRMDGLCEYVCTSPHDSVMPSQQRFMPRWKCVWWLLLWSLRIRLRSLSCFVWLRNLFPTEL